MFHVHLKIMCVILYVTGQNFPQILVISIWLTLSFKYSISLLVFGLVEFSIHYGKWGIEAENDIHYFDSMNEKSQVTWEDYVLKGER
jgi:hypothetical protein